MKKRKRKRIKRKRKRKKNKNQIKTNDYLIKKKKINNII